jgi:hypothetical protein
MLPILSALCSLLLDPRMLHPAHRRNHCKAQELFIQALTINPQDDNTVLRHAMSHHFMKELVSTGSIHSTIHAM